MYLNCLDGGHRFFARQVLRLTGRFAPGAPLDVVKVLMYRPDYFGARFCQIGQTLMRGPERAIGWSIGERELVAAFTSILNHCVF